MRAQNASIKHSNRAHAVTDAVGSPVAGKNGSKIRVISTKDVVLATVTTPKAGAAPISDIYQVKYVDS